MPVLIVVDKEIDLHFPYLLTHPSQLTQRQYFPLRTQYDDHTTTACPFLRRLWDVCGPEDASSGRITESGSRGARVGCIVD
jgi:hypothetical protein